VHPSDLSTVDGRQRPSRKSALFEVADRRML
jgi:hypothetical protein